MSKHYSVEASKNFAEWQSFVGSSDSASIFQTSYWARALKKAGLNALLIVARDRRGDIVGGMLSHYNTYSILKLDIIPSIAVMGGPLVYDFSDRQLVEIIIRHFDVKSRKLGALHSFVRSFLQLDDIMVNQLGYGIEYDRLPCTVIQDLTKSVKDIWKSMHRAGRRGIRKAEKAGVYIEEGKGLDDLMKYHRLQIRTSKRLKIPIKSFQFYRSIWETFRSRNNVKIFLAKYKNEPIAGCIILRWYDKMWYWDSGSIPYYWRLYPNDLLQWHVINWGINEGVRIYDLLGIPCKKDEKHPKYGLYLFKTQFGGKIVRHGEYVKHYFHLRYALLKKLLPIYARFSALKEGR